MIEPVFVDTRVLIYSLDTSEPLKHERSVAWLDLLWDRRQARTSVQVLHELYLSLTRKLSRPLDEPDARSVIRSLMAWRPHSLGEEGLEQAWVLQDRYELSWWDSQVVASAWIQGCRHILTDDLQHNRDLGGVTVVNPFVVFPSDMAARPKT